ncbi:hypothetical protein OF83DRAFT_1086200 [Amylostereum chailletii]|nr:hypothetical protein OF83DRAFT_1086200 [Amylostereum chailletii]
MRGFEDWDEGLGVCRGAASKKIGSFRSETVREGAVWGRPNLSLHPSLTENPPITLCIKIINYIYTLQSSNKAKDKAVAHLRDKNCELKKYCQDQADIIAGELQHLLAVRKACKTIRAAATLQTPFFGVTHCVPPQKVAQGQGGQPNLLREHFGTLVEAGVPWLWGTGWQ